MQLPVDSIGVSSSSNSSGSGIDADTEAGGAYSIVQLVIGAGLMPLACVLGIVGNCLCMLVFVKPKMRTSTNIYLLVLSFGDLIKLVNDLMYTASVLCKYFTVGGDNLIYVNYYQFGYFLSQYSSSVAAWMTVAVAFERFLMIVYPTACRGALTVAKATNASLVISLVVLLLTAPIGLRYRKVPAGDGGYTLNVTDLWTNHFSGAYSIFQSSFRCIAPLALLIVLNACIIVSVRRTRANRRLAARNRITLMLIIVICIFIAFALPDAAMTLFGLGYHEVSTDAQRIAREVTDLLLTLNSAHNFFLYMFFNTIFLEVCLDSFCGCLNSERKARLLHSQSLRDRRMEGKDNDRENNGGDKCNNNANEKVDDPGEEEVDEENEEAIELNPLQSGDKRTPKQTVEE